MTMMPCSQRRLLRPLRHYTIIYLIFIALLLDYCVIAQENEAELEENVDEPSRDPFRTENGLFVLSQVDDITKALHPVESRLVVVAVYSPSCRYCASLLHNLESAAIQLSRYFESINNNVLLPPLLAKLDATLLDSKLLENQLDVTSFPSLLFVKGTQEKALLTDWFGSVESSEDVFQTILHYWYRWNHDTEDAVVRVEDDMSLHAFLTTHAAGAIRHLPPQLNPNLSLEETSHIEWLLSEEGNGEDFYVIMLQCGGAQPDEEFQQVSQVLSGKRNILFLHVQQIKECTQIIQLTDIVEEGTIAALLITPPSDWTKWKDFIVKTLIYDEEVLDNKYDYLEQWVVTLTTPSVLWYERKSVAPIAFASYRSIHAVLFVDVDEYTPTRFAIQQFRETCRYFKIHQDEDFVCFIVPQTERLILKTFGIDLWTPLDVQVTQGGPIQPVLPTMLITDQQSGNATLRYYLDATEILTSTTAIYEFMEKFWNKQLTPALQTSDRPARINDSGVLVVTGASFRQAVLETTDKHTLLYMFAPTCGHCKRFSILWNELARLVTHMGWGSVIDIAKMDVTVNQVAFADFTLDVAVVPDVYYFPRGNKKAPIRYDVEDEFGDTAGRLSDSLDIVEWLLDVTESDDLLDKAELLQLLGEQDENTTKKSDKKESDL